LSKSKTLPKSDIIYRFKFTSLISPYLLTDLRLFHITSSPSTKNKSTILLKQSYLLLTWFYYLKNQKTIEQTNVRKLLKFSFLPTKRTVYTLTKAPMAHKTNSKEQFVFRIFKFTTSIQTNFMYHKHPNSIDSALLILFLTKSTFPIFETNLLFLKNYTFVLKLQDPLYFNYYYNTLKYSNSKRLGF
jgi:hypothetical protein